MWKDKQIEACHLSPVWLEKYAALSQGFTFKLMIAGGSVMTAAQSHAIRASLGNNLWSTYSVSEVGTISFVGAAQIEATYGCVGKPCPGVTVEIQSDEVCVKTGTMATGIVLDSNGWFHTGDLGKLAADGTIVLTGRK